MSTKEWLMRYRYIKIRIDNLKEHRESLNNALTNCVIPLDGKEKAGGGSKGNPNENKLIDLADVVDKLKNEHFRLLIIKAEIENAISEVDDNTYAVLLRLRYIDCKTWEEIAEIMNFDVRHIYRLHGNALKAITI